MDADEDRLPAWLQWLFAARAISGNSTLRSGPLAPEPASLALVLRVLGGLALRRRSQP